MGGEHGSDLRYILLFQIQAVDTTNEYSKTRPRLQTLFLHHTFLCVVGRGQRCGQQKSFFVSSWCRSSLFLSSIMKTSPVGVGKIMFLFLVSLLSLQGWYGPRTTLAVNPERLEPNDPNHDRMKFTHLRAVADVSSSPVQAENDRLPTMPRALDPAVDCRTNGGNDPDLCLSFLECHWVRGSCRAFSCRYINTRQECHAREALCFWQDDACQDAPCHILNNAQVCADRDGCTWDATIGCRLPCIELGLDECLAAESCRKQTFMYLGPKCVMRQPTMILLDDPKAMSRCTKMRQQTMMILD